MEHESLDLAEQDVRREVLARLAAAGESTAVDPTILLQFIRGYWAEATDRVGIITHKLTTSLAWRRELQVDTLLTSPPEICVRDFGAPLMKPLLCSQGCRAPFAPDDSRGAHVCLPGRSPADTETDIRTQIRLTDTFECIAVVWRKAWGCDYYGEDAFGHPIVGHRLGSINPGQILQFEYDHVKLHYARDLEFLRYLKLLKSANHGPQDL